MFRIVLGPTPPLVAVFATGYVPAHKKKRRLQLIPVLPIVVVVAAVGSTSDEYQVGGFQGRR